MSGKSVKTVIDSTREIAKWCQWLYIFQVETIGDAYMVVAGAPEVCNDHSARILDMALDMVDALADLRDPSTGGSMKIRIGMITLYTKITSTCNYLS